MGNTIEKPKKNLGESIRQRLKNLSDQRNRPFDEILRYYAMERFLYRLSISPHAKKFFLKGGLIKSHEIQSEKLSIAIREVFTNRKTPFKRPVAFTAEFYDNKETQQRWNNFLSTMGKPQIKFEDVILELSRSIEVYLDFPT